MTTRRDPTRAHRAANRPGALFTATGAVTILALTVFAQAALAQGQPKGLLANVFQDHAVLQRGRPIILWGAATPGEQLTVALEGRQATAKADGAGRWTATLPAMEAGGPYSVEVRAASGGVQTVTDILLGDVWLCSGQSNMEMALSAARGGQFALRSANDKLRLVNVAHDARSEPLADFQAPLAWKVAGPTTVRDFSAACYFFARQLQETVKVPMGLINASWGGAAAEPWLSAAGAKTVGGFDDQLDLLRLYARDPDAANQRMGRIWEDWWRAHPNVKTEPWQVDAARTGEWRPVPEPMRSWKTWGVPELANHDGMVWYRRTVRLTADQAARGATLALGGIDEVDQTWVNGRAIRNTFGWGTERTYPLPAGTLRAGDNVLVVNVLSTWDAGGMMGPAEKMSIAFADGTKVPLGGGWQYQIVPLPMGRATRAPWESVSGLTTLYNGMIAPLGPFGIRGALWYQGETNADAPAGYEAVLRGLMAGWRGQFGADLPFLIVQLPNFGAVPTAPTEAGWADIREAQRRAVAGDAHAGLAVTIDLGEPGNLHPGNKQDVGARLARAARHVIYGEAIAPSGPVPVSAQREPGRIVVTFGEVEGQLITYGASQAIGFELCGNEKGSCRYAGATAEGNRVVVALDGGAAPARVRYAWAPSPLTNLSDKSGLPVGPFEIAIK